MGEQGDDPEKIIARQSQFYRNNLAGCGFAAYAARDPGQFRWSQQICPPSATDIDRNISEAITDPDVATLSLIFPAIYGESDLRRFLPDLHGCSLIYKELDIVIDDKRCLGYRARVSPFVSWITGFGPFPFFPETRRAPFLEMAMRVKPRPAYEHVMKEAPEGVIHLADMNMQGMPDLEFKKLWKASKRRTAKLLGHKPDLESAAKTTFVVPADWET